MKRWVLGLLVLGIVLLPRAYGLTDVAGVLETGNATVQIDSVTWFLITIPAPITESTPNWGGPAQTADTFQFQQKSEWPQRAILYYQINGIQNHFTIEALATDTWYDLPGYYGFQAPRVRFEDTVLVGIGEGANHPGGAGISILPNPATSGIVRVFGLEPITRATLSIYDITGKEIARSLITANPSGIKLDLTHTPRGLYLIRVRGEGFDWKQKVLLIGE